MSLQVSDSGSTFELPPAGVHPARCYRLVDLGTQTSNWQGKETRQPKVSLAFELLGEERMSDGKPFSITRRLTASLGEKATLRALLKSWRGRDFTADELKRFDLKTIVGAYCLANIVTETKDGNTYANLAGVMPLPKGMPRPDPVNDILVFDLSEPDNDAWERLSERMQDTILASPEGDRWMNGTAATDMAGDPAAHAAGADVDFDDDIPF